MNSQHSVLKVTRWIYKMDAPGSMESSSTLVKHLMFLVYFF